MLECEYSELPSDVELRDALQLLDRALKRQRARLREAQQDAGGGKAMPAALRRSVELMELEALRLRAFLSGG